jgi:hypothetical protein
MANRHSYQTITDWQRPDEATGEAIRAFWIREQANVAGSEATRRLAEVVAHTVDENGAVAAVATATPKVLPRLGQPLYYYRCFVGKAWRTERLLRPLMRHTQKVLEAYARENDYPCIGMLLELENQGFADTLRRAHWTGLGFSYIGVSPRGLDLRVWYFRGARLKTPAQLASLRTANAGTMQLRAAAAAARQKQGASS